MRLSRREKKDFEEGKPGGKDPMANTKRSRFEFAATLSHLSGVSWYCWVMLYSL